VLKPFGIAKLSDAKPEQYAGLKAAIEGSEARRSCLARGRRAHRGAVVRAGRRAHRPLHARRTTTMPGKHAIFSPSGFKALMLCPAKPAMERGLPDASSDYADEGTAAHFLASYCLERMVATRLRRPPDRRRDEGRPCDWPTKAQGG
jgi:hypothetical protein